MAPDVYVICTSSCEFLVVLIRLGRDCFFSSSFFLFFFWGGGGGGGFIPGPHQSRTESKIKQTRPTFHSQHLQVVQLLEAAGAQNPQVVVVHDDLAGAAGEVFGRSHQAALGALGHPVVAGDAASWALRRRGALTCRHDGSGEEEPQCRRHGDGVPRSQGRRSGRKCLVLKEGCWCLSVGPSVRRWPEWTRCAQSVGGHDVYSQWVHTMCTVSGWTRCVQSMGEHDVYSQWVHTMCTVSGCTRCVQSVGGHDVYSQWEHTMCIISG